MNYKITSITLLSALIFFYSCSNTLGTEGENDPNDPMISDPHKECTALSEEWESEQSLDKFDNHDVKAVFKIEDTDYIITNTYLQEDNAHLFKIIDRKMELVMDLNYQIDDSAYEYYITKQGIIYKERTNDESDAIYVDVVNKTESKLEGMILSLGGDFSLNNELISAESIGSVDPCYCGTYFKNFLNTMSSLEINYYDVFLDLDNGFFPIVAEHSEAGNKILLASGLGDSNFSYALYNVINSGTGLSTSTLITTNQYEDKKLWHTVISNGLLYQFYSFEQNNRTYLGLTERTLDSGIENKSIEFLDYSTSSSVVGNDLSFQCSDGYCQVTGKLGSYIIKLEGLKSIDTSNRETLNCPNGIYLLNRGGDCVGSYYLVSKNQEPNEFLKYVEYCF